MEMGALGDFVSESSQRLGPELIEVFAQRIKPCRIELIQPSSSDRVVHYEVGVLENAQVLRDCRPAYWESPGDSADRHGATSQAGENGSASRVAEGIKLSILVSCH